MQNKQDNLTGAFASAGIDVLLGRTFATEEEREKFWNEIQVGLASYMAKAIIEDSSDEEFEIVEHKLLDTPEGEERTKVLLDQVGKLDDVTQQKYAIAFKKAVFLENLAQVAVFLLALEEKNFSDTKTKDVLNEQRSAYSKITEAITFDHWDEVVNHLASLYAQDLLELYREVA